MTPRDMSSDQPKALQLHDSPIPGLFVIELPVHGDNRGWFKENWQRATMTGIGLPDFGPVQNNISFNSHAGTTRGIHAEPWDKYVSVGSGRIFGAWVDLREGATFGRVFTTELDPSRAVYVPRGVGNAFQTLDDDTVYTYLVNAHWSAAAQQQYTFLNLADETADIPWPISLEDAELSEKDRGHPRLASVTPMSPKAVLVLGASGQLGRALTQQLAGTVPFRAVTAAEFDIADPAAYQAFDWSPYDTVINAAAYTNVDGAETDEGRTRAWEVNASAVTQLARTCAEHRLTLVHVSSDYVFDGNRTTHDELELYSPLGVYGQTKAAGDVVAATAPRHYIVRTSWVVGDGHNFVKTMRSLAEKGVDPSVVDDQIGRLSFTSDIAAAILHLLQARPAYGTYNVTNSGEPRSWADVARAVFAMTGHDPARITGVTTAEYFASASTPVAPRPAHSTLTLDRIVATGYTPRTQDEALAGYLGLQ